MWETESEESGGALDFSLGRRVPDLIEDASDGDSDGGARLVFAFTTAADGTTPSFLTAEQRAAVEASASASSTTPLTLGTAAPTFHF